MGINIKNPETERLIRELAELTGKGQTEVVTEAVAEKLNRLRREGLAERLLTIGRETAPLLKELPDFDSLYSYLDKEVQRYRDDPEGASK
jgi:antitoxin VapB